MITLAVTVILIGAFTYAFRILPFIFQESKTIKKQGWLTYLGSCILISMAVTILYPTFFESINNQTVLPTLSGVIGTIAIMLITRNIGLATLFGTLSYYFCTLIL